MHRVRVTQNHSARVAIACVRVLPPRVSEAWGGAIGRAVYLLDRRHRRIALDNVAAAFPGRPASEQRAIVRGALEHLAEGIADERLAEAVALAAHEHQPGAGADEHREGYSLGAVNCAQKAAGKEVFDELFTMLNNSIKHRMKKLLVITGANRMRNELHGFLAATDIDFIAGAAMAAEIASMRVSEQVDALEVMAVDQIGRAHV